MKQLLFASVAALLVLSAVSCKRNYSCLCKEDVYILNEITNQNTRIEDIKAGSKSQASDRCISKNSESIDEYGSGHKTICDVMN